MFERLIVDILAVMLLLPELGHGHGQDAGASEMSDQSHEP